MTTHSNIQGIFKLTAPMHVADSIQYSLDDKGYVVRKTNGMANVIATMRQNILTDGMRVKIPYFPANDLRGRLRRKAAALVMEALAAKGDKVPVELYAGLCAGASGAKPENSVTIEEIKRASEHVYMGLFGGGTRMLRSRFIVSDGVPIMNATVKAGLVPKGFGPYESRALPLSSGSEAVESGDGYKLTEVRHIVRVDDVTRVMRSDELRAHVQDAENAVAQWQANVLQNRSDRKNQDEQKAAGEETASIKKSDLANVVSVQSIIAGTELYVRFDLQDTTTPAQRGLLLCALRDLINEQALGGWIRNGFGKFTAEHFTANLEDKAFAPFALDDKTGELKLTDAAGPMLEAMKCELAALTVPSLMEFFTGKQPKEKVKKAKEAA